MFNLTSLFLFLTIATFPLYLLPSGGVQVSHGFFGLFFVCFFSKFIRSRKNLRNKKIKRIFNSLLVFVAYVIVVQLAFGASYQSPGMVKYALFYIFNFIYVLSIYHYLRVYGQSGINLVFIAILASILLTFGGLMAGVSTSTSRGTSFFNNPNQLGYFALITMVSMLVFHTVGTLKFAKILSFLAIGMCLYMTAASLSKAALVSGAFALICFLPSFKRSEVVLFSLLVLVTSPIWIGKITESRQYEQVVRRIENIGQQDDDSLMSRGYGRIARYPQYILTGAGEGDVGRFHATYEIHSTWGSLLFCYGLIGFGIFTYFNFQCFQFSRYLYCILFVPVFAYGMTHNGIRFSYLWLLYAIFLILAEVQNQSSQRLAFYPKYVVRTGLRSQPPSHQPLDGRYSVPPSRH